MTSSERSSDFERRTKRAVRRQRGCARRGDALAAHAGALSRARGAQGGARRGWRWSLVPAGTVAATALVVVVHGLANAACDTTPCSRRALGDLEILLGEEDLEMLDEEIEFYGWLEEQPEFAGADDSVG